MVESWYKLSDSKAGIGFSASWVLGWGAERNREQWLQSPNSKDSFVQIHLQMHHSIHTLPIFCFYKNGIIFCVEFNFVVNVLWTSCMTIDLPYFFFFQNSTSTVQLLLVKSCRSFICPPRDSAVVGPGGDQCMCGRKAPGVTDGHHWPKTSATLRRCMWGEWDLNKQQQQDTQPADNECPGFEGGLRKRERRPDSISRGERHTVICLWQAQKERSMFHRDLQRKELPR